MHPLILLGLILVAESLRSRCIGASFDSLARVAVGVPYWFVFSAFVGAGAYGIAYDAIFGDATGALTTTTSLVFLSRWHSACWHTGRVGWVQGAAALIGQRIQR